MQFENRERVLGSHVLAAPSVAQQPPVQFDIWEELEELQRSPEWKDGIARKVLVEYPELQITLRAMKANTRIPRHHNPGRVCVQMVQGHIRMHVEDGLVDLTQGKALILNPGVSHDVEALEESAFLLIIAPPTASRQ
jgi:quercetin dioxygenase-like cupin family protein